MSHATVLVIGEDVDGLLEPLNEGIEMPEYIDYLSDDDVKSMRKHYEEVETKKAGKQVILSDEDLVKKMEDWHGSEGGVDEKGIYRLNTYNPDSKWDWYQVGGRWTGMLNVKKGVTPERGEPSLLLDDKSYKAGTADTAMKKDIKERLGYSICTAGGPRKATHIRKKALFRNRTDVILRGSILGFNDDFSEIHIWHPLYGLDYISDVQIGVLSA